MKRIFVDFDDEDFDILNRIVIDGNYSVYIRNFLRKELFSKIRINNITPSHIQYYEEVERLLKLLKIRQQDIAHQLGFSQAAIAKSFKTRNDRSVIYRKMLEHGTPANFVFDIFVGTLERPDISILVLSYVGRISEYLRIFGFDEEKYNNLLHFIMLLCTFSYLQSPKRFDRLNFSESIQKLDRKLLLDFDESTLKERDAELLYNALYEYYLSMGS